MAVNCCGSMAEATEFIVLEGAMLVQVAVQKMCTLVRTPEFKLLV